MVGMADLIRDTDLAASVQCRFHDILILVFSCLHKSQFTRPVSQNDTTPNGREPLPSRPAAHWKRGRHFSEREWIGKNCFPLAILTQKELLRKRERSHQM